jgi:NAD(P)-dependent dehydrogenase (short-subunit alcohol dehydrogenase family)
VNAALRKAALQLSPAARAAWLRDGAAAVEGPGCRSSPTALGTKEEADAAVKSITDSGDEVVAVQADIADEKAVGALFDSSERKFGGIDVVVHCAGVMLLSPLFDLDLESAAQLAVSWIDDFDGALQAASRALDGFREQNEPFMGWAALTVGLLEMTLGRHDAARDYLTEATAVGGQFGNEWLESSARTARLACCEHRPTRRGSSAAGGVAGGERGHRAQHPNRDFLSGRRCPARSGGKRPRGAAMAVGTADGLRQRAGLRAWSSMRRGEAQLATRVAQEIHPDVFKDTFTAGTELNQPEAVALVRGQ